MTKDEELLYLYNYRMQLECYLEDGVGHYFPINQRLIGSKIHENIDSWDKNTIKFTLRAPLPENGEPDYYLKEKGIMDEMKRVANHINFIKNHENIY